MTQLFDCDICGDPITDGDDYFIVKCFVNGAWTTDDSVYCEKCYNENEKKKQKATELVNDLYGKIGTKDLDQGDVLTKLKEILDVLEE